MTIRTQHFIKHLQVRRRVLKINGLSSAKALPSSGKKPASGWQNHKEQNIIHLLLRSPFAKLSDTIKEFKSFTARKILEAINTESESRREWVLNLLEFSAKQHKRNEKYQVWTHENHAEIIYSNKFIDQKIRYIHENSVRLSIERLSRM